MIVDLPDTTTTRSTRSSTSCAKKIGAVTMGRVLTLIIAPDSDAAARGVDRGGQRRQPRAPEPGHRGDARRSRTPPSRGWMPRCGRAATPAPARSWCCGCPGRWPVTPSSVVIPFLLPDIPVVAWWPDVAPAVPAQDPLGKLAIRRITDATNADRPVVGDQEPAARLHRRRHRPGLGRITYWRALLTSAVDQTPHEPIESALISGLQTEPALDVLAGWLASRIDGPVRRGGRRPQSRAGAQERDHRAEPAAGGHDGHPEPDGPARRPGSVGAQGNP